ncbi:MULTISPECIES: hypothetical protein [Pseudomonas]|uniref:hypothetical protein n=1 Tax=Pseudomonas TaxID=286 RepID=UPI0025A471EB|nr:hypothetical protein [Pseudomonas asiatica]WJN50004.1 hypothetical protein QUR91_25770 [Pseudomonas asiatica]
MLRSFTAPQDLVTDFFRIDRHHTTLDPQRFELVYSLDEFALTLDLGLAPAIWEQMSPNFEEKIHRVP